MKVALRRNLVMSGSIAARAVVPLVPVQHVAITALKIRPSKLLAPLPNKALSDPMHCWMALNGRAQPIVH